MFPVESDRMWNTYLMLHWTVKGIVHTHPLGRTVFYRIKIGAGEEIF